MSLNITSANNSFIEKTCRACCCFDSDDFMNFHPIFEFSETGESKATAEFANVFDEFFLWNLEIKHNDGLPQQMCTECLDRFVQVNVFRKQVTDSQELLLSCIGGNQSENANVSTKTTTEGDQPNELKNFDKLGYISPSKLIEYVGYEEEEDFLNFSSSVYDAQADNLETNESDYLFNHPNVIEIHKSSNNTMVVVNPNDFKKNTNSEEFAEKGSTPLTANEVPKPNKLESEKNTTFQCDVCMKFIPSLSKLKRHTQQFHIRKDYVCSICNTKFEQITQRKYYNHMNTHRPKEHKCSYCEKAFIQKIHLINHERIHTKEQPYECDECGKKYRQEITLQEHKLKHKDPFPWKCEICGKGLRSRSCLVAHMRCHSDGYQCEVCGTKFTDKPTLKKHKLEHNQQGDNIYQCKFCLKSFRRPFQLGNHFHTHHLENSNTRNSYRCTECDFKFDTASDLIEHRITHESVERPFSCGSCGKHFMKKTNLKIHIDVMHLKQKSFVCMHCHKSFFDLSDLNAHLKIHNNQDGLQYKCNECEKMFSSKKSLNAHLVSHSNEKAYKCTFCEESFKYRNNLGDHVLSHFLDAGDDSIVKDVRNDKDFVNLEDELELDDDYNLLDSMIEEF